jgi:pantothenate kinase
MCIYLSYNIVESKKQSTVRYTKKTVRKSFLALIHTMKCDYEKLQTKPYILGVAGPPGCGKSTVSSLFKILLEDQGIETHVLPLDGFHLEDGELKKRKLVVGGCSTSLYERKGAKQTYNVDRLIHLIGKLKSGMSFYWPLYSRSTHNPVEKGIAIEKSDAIYIVEGNYLFLDCEPWNALGKYFDRKLFISSKKMFLRRRIIKRKRDGGFSKTYAKRHYKVCDSTNIDEVLSSSSGYQHLLIQRGSHRYTLVNL